jgi:hypothetical protein
MSLPNHPTPYADVNSVLHYFAARIQTILESQFLGMYLYGSLALGDFDPQTSDIDFIVVTKNEIAEKLFSALQEMHEQFDASSAPEAAISLWAKRIEAAYIAQEALHHSDPTAAMYPQLEKGTKLFNAPLEIGWAFQLHSLREHGIVIAGPDPRTITNPVELDSMRRAVAAIAGGWQEQAGQDPEWLDWVRQRDAQSFVVLTLCRMLYSLETGDVASKPAAARWAKLLLGERWSCLIDRALTGQHVQEKALDRDVEDTLVLIGYAVEKSQLGYGE